MSVPGKDASNSADSASRWPTGPQTSDSSGWLMTLAERVRHTVERSTRDVPGGLTVAVGMGRLVVRGRVPTEEVRARVMGIAREAAPRVAVDDKLFVMR